MLEIGCGWGGFARFAAEEYGCRVTGLTISAAQAEVARERTAGLDVRILEQDYREHEGSYAKVASIEMLEAIGERQFGTYFATIDRLLEPDGIACVQTILVPDDRWERYRASRLDRALHLPGLPDPVARRARVRGFRVVAPVIHELDEIGVSYAETLRRWRSNFHRHLGEVRALGYDERFVGRGTSTSPSARSPSARGRSATCSSP